MMTISEHDLQSQCVQWFRAQYPKKRMLLFSSLNGARLAGTKMQRVKQWRRLEQAGAVKGVPDLFLSIPSGDLAGLYIEMKTPKGRQTPEQKEFEVNAIREGYGYAVPRSLDEFIRVVRAYLERGEY